MKIAVSLLVGASLLFVACSSNDEKKKVEPKVVTTTKEVSVKKQDKPEIKVKEEATVEEKDKSYYYTYNKNDASVNSDIKSFTPVEAQSRVRSPYEKVEIQMLVGQLSKNFIVKCSACHNDYANGIIGPSLLAKDAEFIEKSIQAFKHDKTKNILMYELVNQMDDQEIKILSSEIANFNQKIRELRTKGN